MKDDKVFIRHIHDEVNFIIKESKDLRFEDLIENAVLKKALVRSLEIIGEATKNLSTSFREKHTDIEWKELAGLRDKLIHRYFEVDWDTVWDVVKGEIPKLKGKLEKLME